MITRMSEKKPTLKEAQRIVGGYVELVMLANGDQLYCDEDGISKGLGVNPKASRIARQTILGDVLILSGNAKWE